MTHRSPILRTLWLTAGVGLALLFVALTQRALLAHFDYVANATDTNLVNDAQSPTGYANGQRRILIGANAPEGYAWLAQTQAFLSQKSWRIRKTDTDNAPDGRTLTASSPYRWWLALVAKVDHRFHSEPLGQNVERAALLGDVWLVALATLGVFWTARRWGMINAGWLALGLTLLFPAGEFFAAGEPQNRGLFALLSLGAVLPLLAAPRMGWLSSRLRFLLSGLATTGAIWIQPSWGVVLLIGIVAAEILTRVSLRWSGSSTGSLATNESAWWCWALAGAITSLAAFAIDFAPESVTAPRLDIISPLYALLYLTAGATLAWLGNFGNTSVTKKRNLPLLGITFVAVAVSGLGCYRAFHQQHGPFQLDPLGHRLTLADRNGFADSLSGWIIHHDPSAILFAVLVPILLIPLGFLGFFDRRLGSAQRLAMGRATWIAAIVGVWSFSQLRMFGWFDWLLLLVFFTLVEGTQTTWIKQTARGLLGLACVLGAFALSANLQAPNRTTVNREEIQALVARDLAEWLNLQASDPAPIVLAAPDLSSALSHFGGLRVVTSATPENQTGLAAATHILFSTSQDEAQASAQRRQIAFIVLATWDPFFDQAVQRSGIPPDKTLLGLLEGWRPPRWLRPIPYPMPQIAGFEGERVTVFEVVDVQENVVALSHLAEYFAETDQLSAAKAVCRVLETHFADDLGASVARIEVAATTGDPMADATAWAMVNAHLTDGTPDTLPWDRRIALVAILAQAKRIDEAKAQLEASLHDADETLLRTLSPRALYRFQSLLRVLHVDETPAMRETAMRRLPEEMRRALAEKSSP